jgi:sterol desaturase/sphingolipid hydroxylase (fatty acid hydroxylase superfamily)
MGNFGDVLPWWDALFGTYIAAPEGGEGALVHGLRGIEAKNSLNLWSMLTLPFRPDADLERVGEARAPREDS